LVLRQAGEGLADVGDDATPAIVVAAGVIREALDHARAR
jgi:hypothetical protein